MSGLIYGAIVLIWVAVLVPMWLRRHDDALEDKSVDRFSTAMTVLARRTSAPDVGAVEPGSDREEEVAELDRRTAAEPGSTQRTSVDDSKPSRISARLAPLWTPLQSAARRVGQLSPSRARWLGRRDAPEETPALAGAPVRVRSGVLSARFFRAAGARRPASAAVRRQRVLAVLTMSTVLLAALAAGGVVPWAVAAVAGLMLIAYVTQLVVLARRAATGPARALPEPHGAASPRPGSRWERSESASHTVKVTPAPARRGAVAAQATVAAHPPVAAQPSVAAHPTVPANATAAPHSTEQDAAAARDRIGAAAIAPFTGPAPDGFAGPRVGWDPVPVPAPTYVNAPRAPRAVRAIDLASEGAWTSGRLVADARAAAAAALDRPTQRDDDMEPARRAVGD